MMQEEKKDQAVPKELFTPLKIGRKKVRNRIVSTSHAVGWDKGTGLLTDRHIRYHSRKAEGGAGLIMAFGSASVYKESSASYGSIRLWDERNEEKLKILADQVHDHGGLIISQATHMGRRGNSDVSGYPVKAVSQIPEEVHREVPHVLREEEIEEIIQAFAAAARRLEKCGFDGIEVTSFGGHLIEQFWSPKINNRNDAYGGDFDSRMKFSIDVLKAVNEAVSEDFLICFRMTADPKTADVGLTREDMLKIAKKLDDLDIIDMFSISGGSGASFKSQSASVPGDTFERGLYNPLAKIMKAHLSVPVLIAGRNLDASQAEEALLNEECDLVGMTRAIIADPDMPNLVRNGESHKVRPCNACTEGCIGRLYNGKEVLCTVNPEIFNDYLYDIKKAPMTRKVAIIGGGPGGMEAARVAALRGHDVHLFEASKSLGGKVSLARLDSDRPHYGRHVDWLKKEMERLQVSVYIGTPGTKERVGSLSPDAIIIATGSTSDVRDYTDNTQQFMMDTDILSERVKIENTKKYVVYDREGQMRAGSVANYIAKNGAASVELATPNWSVLEDLDEIQKPEIYRLLALYGVKMYPHKKLVLDENDNYVFKDRWSEVIKPIEKDEMVVLVGFDEGDNDLLNLMKTSFPEVEVHLIGDALSPRGLATSIAEGAKTAFSLS